MTVSTTSRPVKRLPHWLRRRIPLLTECSAIESTIRNNRLHTVCREALCPNRTECYSKRKVTFLILGDACTRSCRFCSVQKGAPAPIDRDEPRRIAEAAKELGLRYVVVTSVTRDDLPDGGASHFAETVRELKNLVAPPTVEVLVPDFKGDREAADTILEARPEIFSHNVETVPRLYHELRKGADYERSLQLLGYAKSEGKEVMTKSALILGLGETMEEVRGVLEDLRAVDCDFLAIGQYLQPTQDQVEVSHFVSPKVFSELEALAYELGFLEVASGPLVRSSYLENDISLSGGEGTCGEDTEIEEARL